jgi:hypothetical protein
MENKTKQFHRDELIDSYMNYALEVHAKEQSVYHFCKTNSIDEIEFYNHFSDLEHLKGSVWSAFYMESIKLLEKDEHFADSPIQEKALGLLYTMFELMKSNRSYVLWSLGEKDLKKLREFKELREHLRNFIKRAMETENEDKMQMLRSNSIVELFWIQFLSILKYWTQDRSAAFEKTDVLIEKSSAVFNDLTQANPLNNLVDLGKFIGKEFVL